MFYLQLSVKPSGHIPKIINLSIANDDAQNKTLQSMFVTHSVYKQFPSHVVQFPEICVQRVDSVTGHQEMSTVLSSYQDIIQHCEKQKNEMSSTCASEILVEDSEIAEPSEKILTEECHERDCVPSRASSSSVDPSIHASAMCPDPDLQRDPSQVLRYSSNIYLSLHTELDFLAPTYSLADVIHVPVQLFLDPLNHSLSILIQYDK